MSIPIRMIGNIVRYVKAGGPVIFGVSFWAYWVVSSYRFRFTGFAGGQMMLVMVWTFRALVVFGITALLFASLFCFKLCRRKPVSRRHRVSKVLFPWFLGCVFIAAVIPSCFLAIQAGRDRDFQLIDTATLRTETESLAASVIRKVNLLQGECICMWGDALQELPTYVASLKPRTLYITANIVILHLGGGGIAYEEGVVVLLKRGAKTQSTFRPWAGMTALDADGAVLRYSVDRSPMLLSADELAAMRAYEPAVPLNGKGGSSATK